MKKISICILIVRTIATESYQKILFKQFLFLKCKVDVTKSRCQWGWGKLYPLEILSRTNSYDYEYA